MHAQQMRLGVAQQHPQQQQFLYLALLASGLIGLQQQDERRLHVRSDGTSGAGWVDRLEGQGIYVGEYARRILRSQHFQPTNGAGSEIAILRGDIFGEGRRSTAQVCAEASRRHYARPTLEQSCLVREMLSDKAIEEMDLWWVVSLFSIQSQDPLPRPQDLPKDLHGTGRWLSQYSTQPDYQWEYDDGFAFVVPNKRIFVH